MNDAIDIIITYVTDRDEEWRSKYNYYRQQEIEAGTQQASNKQAFGKERTRDWEFLPYWFRGIEKNCSWVRYIWFICQSETQVPKWLNRAHPKLKIIYHSQFIPTKFLPTFNPMVIKSFLFNIEGLANNFIESSDDMFFVRKIPEDMFFIDNRPVDDPIIHSWQYKNPNNTAFDKIILNKDNLLHEIYKVDYKYFYHHLPLARNKLFEQQFYLKYKTTIDEALLISKFRHPQNLIWHMYTDALKFENITIAKPIFKNSACFYLSGNDFNTIKLNNRDIIVINDTEFIADFNKLKYKVLQWFDKHFPNKSDFEITDTCKQALINTKNSLAPQVQKTVKKQTDSYLYF